MEARNPLIKIYRPGRRICEFKIVLRNVPGAIAQSSELLYRHGINILSGFQEARDELFNWTFIADLTESEVESKELIEELERLDKVVTVKCSEPKIEHLIIDNLHFPLIAQGERSLIFRSATLNGIMRTIRDIVGRDAGNIIIYQLGVRAGEDKIRHLKEYYKEFAPRDILDIALMERCVKGWCIAEIMSLDEYSYTAEIRAKGLFECVQPSTQRMDRQGSHFFRGYIAGLLTALWDRKISVEEVECMSRGKEACIFKAAPIRIE